MDENKGVNPTQVVEETTTTTTEQVDVKTNENQSVSFDAQQQAKLNSLLKEEREKVLRKLGVASLEEATTKIAKANNYDTLETENKAYKEKAQKVEELVGENAMLKADIRDDAKDIVKGYFKGIGKELNDENLKDFFEKNPTFKSQWVKGKEHIVIGNPKSEENNDDKSGYAEFKKNAGLNRY